MLSGIDGWRNAAHISTIYIVSAVALLSATFRLIAPAAGFFGRQIGGAVWAVLRLVRGGADAIRLGVERAVDLAGWLARGVARGVRWAMASVSTIARRLVRPIRMDLHVAPRT